ncbi:MAG TPA: hypothetical protein VGJ93_01795 [Desulfuromonadaceae bacterium]|jgi:hypothetical protein
MTKTYMLIAFAAAASAVLTFLPGLLEHFSHGLHVATIIVSGHHIIGEIAHSIHPHKNQHQEV